MLNTRGSKRFSRKAKVIAAIACGFAAISIVSAVASGGKGAVPAAKPAAAAPALTNTQASVAVCKALNAGLSYIWGQGTTGYGRTRFERIIRRTPPEQLSTVIAEARDRLAACGPLSAYAYLRGTGSARTVPAGDRRSSPSCCTSRTPGRHLAAP
jgi:hypothetical protein